ncbi:MAG: PAS domain-containing protein [Phycisphaerales bacterium]|nr:PAS domain-containing protein [Phycisphaerales bacterium]
MPSDLPPTSREHAVPDPGRAESSADLNIWTVPASILAGSLIIGAFQAWALLISLAALIWLGLIHRRYQSTLDDALDRTRRSVNNALDERRTTKQIGAILEAADVPVVATNERGQIMHANRAASAILGSGRLLVGEYFDSLITQSTVKEIELLARSGESGHARLELPAAGSMRVFAVAAEPNPDLRGAVCTFTDITELSASVTLKADFAANASHELRTPIASILGAIQTLEGSAKDDPVMGPKLISMISSNATRLDLMVKDLLDLSRLENPSTPTQLIEVDLEEIIERASSPFLSVCQRRRLTIDTRIDPKAATILTDDTLLELILRNLIGNATKFAHENTSISIHADPIVVEVDPNSPLPKGLDQPLGVRIGVRDEGVGIPLSHQARIFERFYQVDEARSGSTARRGTGLGLAIVKHAARSLGGGIRVNSVHQEGTTMIVELPRCVASHASSTDDHSASAIPADG